MPNPPDAHPGHPHDNNFDLLRLVFAGVVCLVHANELSGIDALSGMTVWLSSQMAVNAFFVISGYLVVMSRERSPTLSVYFNKRILRIYPAYVAVIAICATGLFSISTQSASGYFTLTWLRYVASNLLFLNFLQPTLPGVFDNNLMQAVNGALWTLKIEVLFYLLVPLLVWTFKRLPLLPTLSGLYLLSVAYRSLMLMLAERTGAGMYAELARQLPGQMSYFLTGIFFYYFQGHLLKRPRSFVAAALCMLAADRWLSLPWLEPFALGTLVIAAALFFRAGNFSKFGDLSYGVYILHFPIIQVLIDRGWFPQRALTAVAVLAVLVGTAAFAMWHLVEKHFLGSGHHSRGRRLRTVAAIDQPALRP